MSQKSQLSSFVVDVQNNSHQLDPLLILPDVALLERWACAVFTEEGLSEAEVTLRLVDEAEMQDLNARYRGKNYPTNVLSFPSEIPPEIALELPFLGDMILCVQVINREAHEQQKPVLAHWAHMVVHGVLHLRGYNHMKDNEAKIMEEKEVLILRGLNFADPYSDDEV